jgi:hypothetical protein
MAEWFECSALIMRLLREVVGSNPTGCNFAKVTNKIYLALRYFPRGLPPKYRRAVYVSLLSSGWNKVVP